MSCTDVAARRLATCMHGLELSTGAYIACSGEKIGTRKVGPGKNIVNPVNSGSATVSISFNVTQYDGIFYRILREPDNVTKIGEFASPDGTQELGGSSSEPINLLRSKLERPRDAQKLSNAFVLCI